MKKLIVFFVSCGFLFSLSACNHKEFLPEDSLSNNSTENIVEIDLAEQVEVENNINEILDHKWEITDSDFVLLKIDDEEVVHGDWIVYSAKKWENDFVIYQTDSNFAVFLKDYRTLQHNNVIKNYPDNPEMIEASESWITDKFTTTLNGTNQYGIQRNLADIGMEGQFMFFEIDGSTIIIDDKNSSRGCETDCLDIIEFIEIVKTNT